LALLIAPGAGAQSLTVQQALRSALEHRHVVSSSQLGVEAAQQSARALSTPSPLVLGLGQSSLNGLGATDQDLFLTQPIDLFGKVSALRNMGRANVLAAQAAQRGMTIRLQSEVINAYFESVAAHQARQAVAQLKDIANSVLKATRRRLEEGKIPEVQGTRANIEYGRATQALALRDSMVRAAQARLAAAMGLSEVTDLPQDTELAVPALNVELRPDILELKAKYSEALARADSASKSSRPDMDLSLLRTPWRENQPRVGLRLQLTWKAWDHGQSKAESQAARATAQSAEQQLLDVRDAAVKEAAALDIEIDAVRQQLRSLRTTREEAAELLTKSQKGFDQGYSTLLDVLEAARSLREIELELVEARKAQNLLIARQYEATGTLLEVSR